MRKKLDALKQGNQVDEARLRYKYDDAIKVAIVHYAVDISRLAGRRKWGERFLPHECQGLDDFVSDLRTEFKFSLALHGHMHIAGLYNHGGIQVVSATTTSEQNGPNGFFLLKLLGTGEIRAEHHSWTGKRFTADPDASLTKQLEIYPKGAVA